MIEKTDGVCGGSACILNTRVAVWMIVELLDGIDDRDDPIVVAQSAWPMLSKASIEAALEYAATHVAEIERERKENCFTFASSHFDF